MYKHIQSLKFSSTLLYDLLKLKINEKKIALRVSF